MFNLAYVAVVLILTVATFSYTLEIKSGAEVAFFTVYFVVSALFLTLMLLTRNEIVTKIIGLSLIPIVFFLIIFNMNNVIIFVPPLIVAILIFFYCSIHENVKVIFGTIFLLLYVIGIFSYFIMNMLFSTSKIETRLDANLSPDNEVYSLYDMSYVAAVTSDSNTISPDGKLQFYICDIQDKENGKVEINVVPYGDDKYFKFFTLKQKGIKKTVKFYTGRGKIPEVYWSDNNVLKYKMPNEADYKSSDIKLPDKNYFGFLGID